LQIDPGHVGALHASANALREAKRYDEALSYYDRALDGSPERDYLRGDRLHAWMHVCHWDGLREELATLAERVSRGERASVPGAAIGVFDDPALQKRIAQTWIADKFANAVTAADMPAYARNAKIRVGYFSADFYDHATMYLMAELFERHDRARFEFTAFSFGPDRDDDMRRRAVAAFDRFIDVRERSDLEIALLARELEIDIAVDLKGHTQDSRAGVFARRAAPIQVNYLGYPGTMGADFIDYLIADSSLVADGDEQHYVERIALLPDSYQPNGRLRGNAEREFTRGELGLPAAGFVYCCFNATYKITPETFDSWMRILGRIDGSVL
jgi:predicted O-linked N-acetylglucosamine transferase (SPINDLY family)